MLKNSMKIGHYSFGRIVIEGKTYTTDVIIYPDRIDPSWWRKKGHLLQIDDLRDIIVTRPDILVIGTGYSGLMVVPDDTVNFIKAKGIMSIIEKTSAAVDTFNRLITERPDRSIIAALHLTC